MRPAWSVLFFTTLAGAGQGLFLALVAGDFVFGLPTPWLLAGAGACLALTFAGLVSSTFHLGHPERGWRAAARWRTSWLSREVIVLPVFLACVFFWALGLWLGWPERLVTGLALLGALLALLLYVCTAMIYACLPFLQEWRTPLTVCNYTALGLTTGTYAAALLAALGHPPMATGYASAALVVGTLAYLGRLASLLRNARLRPKSTLATAIGVKHPKIVQIAQGSMGGSFNTREFFHGRPREVVRAYRLALLWLLQPVPALLLLVGGASAGVLVAALLLHYAGLLAERWYFFAEARHPQNVYYQAIA
ncbi:MAG: dimethyl sulfoxide reductase anchor subunit [Betaproteobacteria bacterium]|nr:dimethyl sulfoxide reductase anchor subunit [Betaproteobacteria bacterium]